MKETDVGRLAAAYLADLGWTCYYEVEVSGLWGRPDIVARRPPLTLIAECKTTMGLAVLGQAMRHLGSAHHVIVVTPRPLRNRHADMATCDLLRRHGIGWLQVGVQDWHGHQNPDCFGARRVGGSTCYCLSIRLWWNQAALAVATGHRSGRPVWRCGSSSARTLGPSRVT